MNARNAYTLCGVDDIMVYAPISELWCMGEDALCVNSILVRILWEGITVCCGKGTSLLYSRTSFPPFFTLLA